MRVESTPISVFGATFWFEAIIVWNAAACVSMSRCTAFSAALYCASFFGENAVLYAASSAGIAGFGYFGGLLSSVAFIM